MRTTGWKPRAGVDAVRREIARLRHAAHRPTATDVRRVPTRATASRSLTGGRRTGQARPAAAARRPLPLTGSHQAVKLAQTMIGRVAGAQQLARRAAKPARPSCDRPPSRQWHRHAWAGRKAPRP